MEDHPKINFGKTGVLLINLGTPESTSWLDIRRYLKEFLSDRRVIEVNPVLWKFILNVFILTFRPSKTAKAYKEIWMEKENMCPLRYYLYCRLVILLKFYQYKVLTIVQDRILIGKLFLS